MGERAIHFAAKAKTALDNFHGSGRWLFTKGKGEKHVAGLDITYLMRHLRRDKVLLQV